MTKLEEQIQKVHDDNSGDALGLRAREALAELVKGYIERALNNYHERLTEVLHVNGELGQSDINLCKEYVIHWLKSEGITE